MPSEKIPRPLKKNSGEETAGGRRGERGEGDKDGSLEASCKRTSHSSAYSDRAYSQICLIFLHFYSLSYEGYNSDIENMRRVFWAL
jgi:hypothetical protein